MNYAIICIDETASMRGQQQRVVSSLNEYVSGLPEHTHISVFTFNREIEWKTYFDNYKKNWVNMTEEDYRPQSMTPLFDSIAKTIHHGEKVSSLDDKVFVMIDTDGQENCSKEETIDSVKALIQQKKNMGWEFWFMANSIDQMSAERIGKTGFDLGMNVASNVYRDRRAVYSAHVGQTMSYFNDDKENTP